MAQFRFVVDGDFVDFYDGAMHAFRVRNTTQDVDWYYETAPGIKFEVDGHRYNTIPSQIEIDGVTLSANTDFDDAIVGIFPNLASGGGPGGTPGIDDVLAEEQTVVSRFIELQSNGLFEVVVGSTRDLLELDTTEGAEHSLLQATNISGLGSAAFLKAETQDGAGQFTFEANYNGETEQAAIYGSASAGGSAIEHTADTHTFNIPAAGVFSVVGNSGSLISIDADAGNSKISARSNTVLSNISSVQTVATQELVDAELGVTFDANGVDRNAAIIVHADVDGSKIEHAADENIFNGDMVLADLAGGGTTGLSIDNDGKIIRTP